MKSLLLIKLRSTLLIMCFIMTSVDIFSQGVAINSSGTSADPSAMLDISSTDKGILIPRMTEAQRLLISNPAIGLIVYQIDNTTGFWYYDGNTWTELSAGQAGSGSMAPGSAAGNTPYWDGIQWVVNSSNIYNNGGSVGIGTTSPDQSATLEVGGVNTGFLLSRLTTAQRNNIQNPASGLQIYNTTTKCFEFYESGYWQTLKCACIPPATPIAALHTSTSSSITWNWNASSGAIGYKYNTTNNFSSATDLGNVTTFTQTGLSSNVTYTLYVWAYNSNCESQAATFTEVPALLASPIANYISERLFEIQWNWKTVSGATGYKYNTINDYATATDNGSSTYYSQTSLKCDSTFILYVWAYNASGHSNAGALTGNTGSMCGPCTGGQPYRTATSITWYWGDCCWGDQTIYYKYNTVNDFNTATDLGTTMYVTQTGLTCNTNYSIYVWEYGNGCVSTPAVLSAKTLSCPDPLTPCTWNSANSFTVTHTAGVNGAPVTKTVTYNQRPSTLTGSSKCWITQNLGASQEATSVDYALLSSGWYWQFNRAQGYEYNGSSVNPSWTINTINENSDWLQSNDPCILLLGSGWRLPTATEWTNVPINGNWNNSNDAYNSTLKLNNSQVLINGSLNGWNDGYYWSSNQKATYYGSGSSLYIYSFLDMMIGGWSGGSYISDLPKAYAGSVRCLRD